MFSTHEATAIIQFARSQALEAIEAENRRLHEHGLTHDAVHDIRVLTKRLRAWARLLKPFDHDFYTRSEANLKAIGKQLSGHRDQKVQQEALAKIQPTMPTELADTLDDLIEALNTDEPDTNEHKQPTHDKLHHSLENALDLEWAHWHQFRTEQIQDPRKLGKRLRKTQKRVRDLARSRHRADATDHHHQWRKWVKRLMFQQQLLQDARVLDEPDSIKALKKLGSQLGKEHDFAMLENAVHHSRPPFHRLNQAQQHQLLKHLKAQRHHHLKKAKKHHKRIKASLKAA
ncbi:MAG: CHAD domain-containing protein [Hydrogenovibrio sp.]|uniref:CHAD domain-containing protein n=1 Tax=Hydrogenovibrio sp. TaxID=2065821 RepID=UPI00286FE414|nr:CHAD domain-containing protein [Hydrogenovibrio sp.]MDR9498397.1 CHAD domain-containing protein [Hydrogenovibrio sp.]